MRTLHGLMNEIAIGRDRASTRAQRRRARRSRLALALLGVAALRHGLGLGEEHGVPVVRCDIERIRIRLAELSEVRTERFAELDRLVD